MYFDPMYLCFMAPALIMMMAVQWYVRSAYTKWSQVPANSRVTGAEAAQRLMQSGGLYEVRLEGTPGELSDHYDPREKVLRLSPGVARNASVASLAIAAHELGHAMQDKDAYLPLRLRGAIVPAVQIGSTLGWVLLIIGFMLQNTSLAWLGVIVFSGGALFALVTLPVELNASSRARAMLNESGLIQTEQERQGVNHVLNAAALTYVAGLVTAVMQLLYFALQVMGMGRRRG